MRSGRLRSKIEFLRQVETKDQYGEKSKTFNTVAFRWGEAFSVIVGEKSEQSGDIDYMTQRFRVRYDSATKSITYSDRIRYNGAIFEIVAIENTENRNKELVFTGARNDRLA